LHVVEKLPEGFLKRAVIAREQPDRQHPHGHPHVSHGLAAVLVAAEAFDEFLLEVSHQSIEKWKYKFSSDLILIWRRVLQSTASHPPFNGARILTTVPPRGVSMQYRPPTTI